MSRFSFLVPALLLSMLYITGEARTIVVADSLTRAPLSNASVFDRRGNVVGMSDAGGRLPAADSESFPLTVRYLGFKEKAIAADVDTVFLQENISELDELVVESRRHRLLHMLAYVREYSTMTTYTDTVFLFREKMVDYMLAPDKKVRFKGWSTPRVLTSRSYYRFTDAYGLDSVSDAGRNHFSWSDWIGMAPVARLPLTLKSDGCVADTVMGRYSPSEIWTKRDDRIVVDVNVMADPAGRRWVPDLSGFFRRDLDFEQFRIRFNYSTVSTDSVTPLDLTGYSYTVESNGRGHDMFRFNRVNEPFFVSTYAEVYIMDREYITVKEAKKWDKLKFNAGEIAICEPVDAPELQPSVMELIYRVQNIDKGQVRLDTAPDTRLIAKHVGDRNYRLGNRVLNLFKVMTGISAYKTRKNFKRSWNEFLSDQKQRNKKKQDEE